MPRPQTVIENPILNTPYAVPGRHFRFDDQGITDDVVAASPSIPTPARRRASSLRWVTGSP